MAVHRRPRGAGRWALRFRLLTNSALVHYAVPKVKRYRLSIASCRERGRHQREGTTTATKTGRFTIKDVARAAAVSTTTISRYLNGRFDAMSEETRQRIEDAIQRLDYKPNQIARGLRSAQSRTLGVLLADIVNPYSIAVLQGIEETCSRNGYSIIVCNSDENAAKERECLAMLESKRVDALIVNTTCQNNELFVSLAQTLPVVLVDRKIPGGEFDTVTTDNEKATKTAVELLLARGCERLILIIAKPDGISPRYERVRAFEEFCASERGRQYDTALHIVEKYEQNAMRDLFQQIVESGSRSGRTGIILGNGVLSLLALKASRELGLRVPNDLLLIGFDDPEWASIAQPTLTVLAQPTYEIGKQAAQLTIARLSRKRRTRPRTVELDMTLIERESTQVT